MELSRRCYVTTQTQKHLALTTGPQEYAAYLTCVKLLGQRPAVEKALEPVHLLVLRRVKEIWACPRVTLFVTLR